MQQCIAEIYKKKVHILNITYTVFNCKYITLEISGCESFSRMLTGGVRYQMRCTHMGQGCSYAGTFGGWENQ